MGREKGSEGKAGVRLQSYVGPLRPVLGPGIPTYRCASQLLLCKNAVILST